MARRAAPARGLEVNRDLLPERPGVYRFNDGAGKALYVGKANSLKTRISSYFQQKRLSPRIALMMAAARDLETVITESPAEALLLENNLIKSLRPKYNILFRDDKSYPVLRLSKHAYPRLLVCRNPAKGGGDDFGPFPDSRAARATADILQRVFRLRTCDDNALATRSRPCLLGGIGRCSAPCVNRISPAAYAADVNQARLFLRGGASSVADSLRLKMEEAAAGRRYEDAAVLRDQLRALATARQRHFAEDAATPDADYVGVAHDGARACVNIVMARGGRRIGERRLFPQNAGGGDADAVWRAFLAQHYREQAPAKIFLRDPPDDWADAAPHLRDKVFARPRGEARQRVDAAAANARQALALGAAAGAAREAGLRALRKRLGLATLPRRMECFDISHSMGEEATAARVVFLDGAPARREYRLYRIRTAAGGDDGAAMAEAARRCYRRAAVLPDVLFVDGGATQVAAVLRLTREAAAAAGGGAAPAVFGIAKAPGRRPGEETLVAADGEMLRLPPTDAGMRVALALRDEAHRFAGAAHRRRRDKKRGASSALDGVDGVGEQKQKRLLAAFGGLPSLRAAGVGDLAKVAGIGPRLAARIYQALRR